jgi:hypothetical protein
MAWKPNYATNLEVASIILEATGLAESDAWIPLVNAAASRAVDSHTRRQFGQLAAPEEIICHDATYRAERGRWVVPIPDLMTTVGLVVSFAGETIADGYLLEPSTAALDVRPWTRLALPYGASYTWDTGDRFAAVTARWGWSAVPDTVKAAELLQVQRFYMRRGSPFGVAGSPDVGSELRLLSKVDPDVGVMLNDYVRAASPR